MKAARLTSAVRSLRVHAGLSPAAARRPPCLPVRQRAHSRLLPPKKFRDHSFVSEPGGRESEPRLVKLVSNVVDCGVAEGDDPRRQFRVLKEIGDDVENRFGFPGSRRPVDHADPVPEGLGDSVALVLVSVERQNDGLIRILRFPVHPVEIGGEGAVGVDEVQPLVPLSRPVLRAKKLDDVLPIATNFGRAAVRGRGGDDFHRLGGVCVRAVARDDSDP